MGRREDRRDRLFDLLMDEPDGITIPHMMAELVASYSQVRNAIRDLRVFLGTMDQINLVCEPTTFRDRWEYRLVGNADDARFWQANRLNDAEGRLETIRSVAQSVARGTPANTPVGRRARRMYRSLDYLMAELADIEVP